MIKQSPPTLKAIRFFNMAPDDDFDDDDDDTSTNIKHLNARRWAKNGDSYYGVEETIDNIPSGLYMTRYSDSVGPIIAEIKLNTDELIEFEDGVSHILLEEFDRFWERKQEYIKRNLIPKRGLMLYGSPGSGKTASINLLSNRVINELNGIVVYIENPYIATSCLHLIRKVEPNRPIVCLLEDFDNLLKQYNEQAFLALLDGETQIDNVIFVATTNYIELIDKRFVNRPSRFDTIIEVDMPSDTSRRTYIKHKEPEISDEELERWVKKSDGLSFAHIRELIVGIKCLGLEEEEVFKKLKKMQDGDIVLAETKRNKLGF